MKNRKPYHILVLNRKTGNLRRKYMSREERIKQVIDGAISREEFDSLPMDGQECMLRLCGVLDFGPLPPDFYTKNDL